MKHWRGIEYIEDSPLKIILFIFIVDTFADIPISPHPLPSSTQSPPPLPLYSIEIVEGREWPSLHCCLSVGCANMFFG